MSSNQKLEVVLVHQSNGHLKVVEEDTSQDKLWLMSSHFSSQNVILPWETYCSTKRLAFVWAQTQFRTGQTSFIFFWIQIYSAFNMSRISTCLSVSLNIRVYRRPLHNKRWFWVFFIQIYLPQTFRTTTLAICNILGFGHNKWG